MEMVLQIVLLIAGFIALIKGADIFVDGSSSLAAIFKVIHKRVWTPIFLKSQ